MLYHRENHVFFSQTPIKRNPGETGGARQIYSTTISCTLVMELMDKRAVFLFVPGVLQHPVFQNPLIPVFQLRTVVSHPCMKDCDRSPKKTYRDVVLYPRLPRNSYGSMLIEPRIPHRVRRLLACGDRRSEKTGTIIVTFMHISNRVLGTEGHLIAIYTFQNKYCMSHISKTLASSLATSS